MKTHKMNMMANVAARREAAVKNGTQHTAVEANDDDASDGTIDIGPDGLPTHEFLLNEGGYVGMNLGGIGGEDSNDTDAANADATSVTSVKSYADALMGHQYELNLFNEGSDKPKKERLRLSKNKLFLDSCATYHLTFVDWCLKNIHVVERYLKGHCIADVTL